jgi:hypothetical protein
MISLLPVPREIEFPSAVAAVKECEDNAIGLLNTSPPAPLPWLSHVCESDRATFTDIECVRTDEFFTPNPSSPARVRTADPDKVSASVPGTKSSLPTVVGVLPIEGSREVLDANNAISAELGTELVLQFPAVCQAVVELPVHVREAGGGAKGRGDPPAPLEGTTEENPELPFSSANEPFETEEAVPSSPPPFDTSESAAFVFLVTSTSTTAASSPFFSGFVARAFGLNPGGPFRC